MITDFENSLQVFRKWYVKKAAKCRQRFMHTVLPLMGIYTLGLLALLRADFNYKDDVGRAASGYREWDAASRYVSDFLSRIIHNMSGGTITDTSPFSQILALLLLAITACCLLCLFTQIDDVGTGQKIVLYCSTIPIVLNPYFLVCLSFKFDAAFMAISILVSVLPLMFVRCKPLHYVCISTGLLLIMCLTYQPSSGIYPLVVTAYTFTRWNEDDWNVKESLLFLLESVAAFGAAMFIFKCVFAHNSPNYIAGEIWAWKDMFSGVVHNYREYYRHIHDDFNRTWELLILALAVLYYIHSVLSSKRHKLAAAVMSALVMFAESLMTFGVLICMKDISFRSRWMYGFGFLLGLYAISLAGRKRAYLGKMVAVCVSWIFFIFAFTYGNDLAVIKAHTDTRTTMIVNSLNTLQLINDGKEYRFSCKGKENWPESIRHHIQGFPVLERMIPGNGKYWSNRYYIQHCFGIENMRYDRAVKKMKLPLLQSTSFYNIRGNDNCILIEYKKN